LSLRPAYHFDEHWFAKARVDLEQELTDADDTTKKHQLVLSDVWLWGGLGELKLEELWDLKVGADLMLVLPLSQASQSQTLRLGVGPGVNVTKTFEVLKGLDIGFLARMSFYMRHYTTAQLDTPWISCGSPDSSSCGRFIQTGERNSASMLSLGPSVDLQITEDLSASLYFQIRRHELFALSDASVSTLGGFGTTADASKDVSARYEQLFIADVSYSLSKELSVSVGAYGVYPELAPDSSYRFPLFNRYTELYLDLTLKLDAILPPI
jgi:hypothetical protein